MASIATSRFVLRDGINYLILGVSFETSAVFSYLRTDIVWPSICSPLSKPSKTCHSCGRMSIFAQKMPCDSSTKTMKTPRSRAGQDTCKILILIQTNLSWLLTSTRKAAEGKSITEQVCIKLIKIFPILLTRLYHVKTLPE